MLRQVQTSSEFSGKVALVSGTSGIGLASAVRLAEAGARVLACGIDSAANAALDAIAAERGLDMASHRTDAAVEHHVRDAVSEVVARFGGLDIIVTTRLQFTPLALWSPRRPRPGHDAWPSTSARCISPLTLASPKSKDAAEGPSSTSRRCKGMPVEQNVAVYVATKGAIHALTRAMALDHAAAGIRVNSISPGSVRTPLLSLAARTYGGEGVSEEEVFRRFGRRIRSAASGSRRRWPSWSPTSHPNAPGSSPAVISALTEASRPQLALNRKNVMKIGLELCREQLTPDNFTFAVQAGATHIVAHLTSYLGGRTQDSRRRRGSRLGRLLLRYAVELR